MSLTFALEILSWLTGLLLALFIKLAILLNQNFHTQFYLLFLLQKKNHYKVSAKENTVISPISGDMVTIVKLKIDTGGNKTRHGRVIPNKRDISFMRFMKNQIVPFGMNYISPFTTQPAYKMAAFA